MNILIFEHIYRLLSHTGITLGKPLIAVTEDQDVKRIQKNVRRGNRKAIKAAKSTLIQNSPLSDSHFAGVLKDTETKENNFQGNDADNKGYVDASPEVDVLTPSALEENVYGELENQEAKNYGFHVEKDDSGGDILLGPITLGNKEIQLENASLSQKLTSSEKQNLHKNVRPVKEQLLKDPLAKVSYLFSQEASGHNSSGKAPYKITSATNKIDNSADNGQNFTKNHNWGKIPASNSTFVGKMAVSSSLPNINTGTTPIKRERNISNDKLTENNQKAFNNTQSSEGRLDNSMQGSVNAQLPELIENVIERLGDEGSRFVSMQLAKHPTVKNIWANAIALALLKQSDKISHLDFGRASNNSLKALPKVDSTKVKSTDTLLQTNVNGEPIRKPGDGFPYSSHGANHMEEPAHTLGITNKTFTFTVMNTSKVAKELNSSTPASSSKLDVAGQKIHDSAKPGTQNEIAKKPIYQAGHIGVISHSFNLSQRLKGQNSTEASKEQVLDKGQLLTPYANGLVSNVHNTIPLQGVMEEKQSMGGKQLQTSSASKTVAYEGSNEQVGENAKEESAEDKKLNDETMLGSMTNNVPSQEYLNQEIDGRFLFNNITKLDPDEAKYLQLNMMGDSMVNRQFSVSAASPYNGMQEEDAKEASYLEHQINDVGHIVGQVLPKPKTTVSDLDIGEANYVTGQLLDNRLGKAEVAESFARDNSLIKEEEKQNSKIVASVQQADIQHQTNPVFVSPDGRNGNMETISESTSSPFERLQSDKYETPVESNLEDQMLLSPKTVSDISAVDLAPMRSLVNFDRLTGTNKPSSSFSYDLHNDGNNQKEAINEGDEAEFMTPYGMNSLPDHLAQLKKKEKIAKTYSSKHKKRKYRRKANLKQSPSFLRKLNLPRKLQLSDSLAVKPTKSRSQPGTRDSEISPTSVIFGLTTNEMKEIEKHLAHGSNRAEAETSGNLQELSPETVAYYEVKPNDEEQKKKERSLLQFMDKPLKVKRLKTERKQLSQNRIASKAIQERKNVTPSRKGKVSHVLSSVHKRKKAKDNSNVRRDLESWEGHTDVLNSDLEQLRDLNPNVQEDISKVILKDYEGDQRNVKGLESFPFDEQDPSYAFERSFKNKKQSAGKGDYKGYRYTQGRLDVKRSPEKMGNEISKKEFQKKGTLSHGSKLSDATMAEPIVMKENKLLNGDVVSLDDVGHLDAQGLILETLRKESEGDLNYVNTVQVDDVSRIKNMFQKVGVEIGVKRHTGAHRKKPNKAFHSRKRILPEKRDLGEFSTEFNDGTFRSPEFEKQLSRALIQERQHDLTYLGAVQAMDDPVLNKMMDHPEEPISSRTILQNQFKSAFPKDDSSDDGSLEKSQEKLREFIHSSSRQDEEADAMKQRTTDSIKDSVFRDLTPEGKVLNSDYKELTNFGTDDQNQLASVLRTVNSGDQNDLKELEKIDSADEKEVESLFRPMAGTFKRSIDEKPGIAREGAIETIADLPDHGSKEKNIVNNIASDFSKNGKNNSKN